MEIQNIFTDPTFRSSSKYYPNRLYGDGKQTGAIAVTRGRGNDFALNAEGLDYVVQAETEGRVKEGYVVLASRNGSTPQFIAAARAKEVQERLRNVTPREGNFGPYHWITVNFQPAASRDDGDVF